MVIAKPMPGGANACFKTTACMPPVSMRCSVDLSEMAFPITPVHHALRIFQSARKAVDVHQVALAWKRALPVALKLREVEKAGKVIISLGFTI